MSAISKLFIELGLRDRKLRGALRGVRGEMEKTERQAGMLRRAFSRIGDTAGGFLVANVIQKGAAAIKDSITGVIMAASDMNETLSKTNAVFGDATGGVLAFAKTSATALGMSELQALNMLSTYGSIGKAAGLTAEASAAWSQQLLQNATDLGSFWNVDPLQAARDIQSGLAGESEPLRKYGIYLNEASIAQEAYRLGLAATGAELTEGMKIQARASLIQKGMGDAAGDFAKTAGGLSNQLRILRALVGNLQVWIGGKLTPTVTRITTRITAFGARVSELSAGGMSAWQAISKALYETLEDVFGRGMAEKVSRTLRTAREGADRAQALFWQFVRVLDALKAVLGPSLGVLTRHLDQIGPAVGIAVAGFLMFHKVIPAIKGASLAMRAFGVASKASLISPIGLVIGALVLLYLAWTNNWGGIQEKTARVIGWLGPKIAALRDFIQPAIDVIVLFGQYVWDVLTNKVQPGGAVLEKFPGWLQPIIRVVGRLVKTIRIFAVVLGRDGLGAALMTIPTQIRALGRAVAGLLSAMGLDRTAAAVKQQFDRLASLFGNVVDLVGAVVDGRWSDAWKALRRVAVDAFWLLIGQIRIGASLIVDVFKLIPWGTIGSLLLAGFLIAVGFLMETGFPWLWEQAGKLWGAIKDAGAEVWDETVYPWIQEKAAAVKQPFVDAYDKVKQTGNDLIGSLGAGLSTGWDWLWGWFKDLGSRLAEPFVNIYNTFYNIGWSVIAGMSAGIHSIWESLTGWIDAIIEQYERIPSYLRPGSPSKLATYWGESVPTGLIAGGEKHLGRLRRFADRMLSTLSPGSGAGASVPAFANAPAGASAVGGAATIRHFNFAPGAVVVKEAANGEKVADEVLRALRRAEAGAI